MSAIGSVINNAIGSATGSNSGTSLQDFLSNFSASDGKWVSTIDPFSSFDLTMKLYPAPEAEKKSKTDKLLGKLESATKGAVKNLVNNATGGLVGAIMNDLNGVSVTKMRDEFGFIHKETFLEYLAAANLLVGSETWLGGGNGQAVRPLELQLGLYCQEATIPNVEMPVTGQSTVNQFGEFPINGTFVKPDNNNLILKILNTKVPLHERIFYPWLREVTLPFWSYQTQPYTTATITIDFTKHCDIKYVFYGCRPQKITTLQGSHAKSATNLTRDVTFLFDFMTIQSKLKTMDSTKSILGAAGKTLFNAASKMAKI